MPEENQALDLAKEFAGAAGTQTVNKIANVFGMLFPYAGLKKLAVDTYVDSIKDSNLPPEEKFVLISGAKQHLKNLNNQLAIAEIAQSAAAPETDFSESSGVDDEWLGRFMDAAKFVSEEDAQHIWGSVLAGEFESPGSTPPSVIRILSELTSRYAKIFANICSLEAMLLAYSDLPEIYGSYSTVIIPDLKNDFLSALGINYSNIMELQQLGLLSYEPTGIILTSFAVDSSNVSVHYGNDGFVIDSRNRRRFPVGYIQLTGAGGCIAKYVDKQVIPGYIDVLKDFFISNGCTIAETPAPIVVQATVEP